jgi:hypothetical protein
MTLWALRTTTARNFQLASEHTTLLAPQRAGTGQMMSRRASPSREQIQRSATVTRRWTSRNICHRAMGRHVFAPACEQQ